MNNPLVSIITPAYNAEAYIEKCIRSVLDQTYTNLELLIVNDGSTDSTEAKVLQFDDPRIRYFKQPNRGVSAARNFAISNMRGQVLCFLDADDWLPSRSLEIRINVLNAQDTVHFADGSVDIYSWDGSTIERRWKPDFKGDPHRLLLRLSPRCFFGPTWMLRLTLARTPKFDEQLKHGEDLLFYVKASEDGGNYDYSDEVVYCYRNRDDSAMKNTEGLAEGYLSLRRIFSADSKFRWSDRFIFEFKIRKIMFLSFLRTGKAGKALRYIFR